MRILHISAECFPVAKAGGLGDVVGSLPKYQRAEGHDSWVVMPAYDLPWIRNHVFETVHEGFTHLGGTWFAYAIRKEKHDTLGFPLYVVDIPSRFGRPGIYVDPASGYGYWDEFERYASFQIATLEWIRSFEVKPDILHCHDHHTALIPFMTTSCPQFEALVGVPTVLTLHNGEYHGSYELGKRFMLPYFHPEKAGYLEWGGRFNALACGIRTCWAITTVSPNYLNELMHGHSGIEPLIRQEAGKARGILNGIDTEVWNPATDPLIAHAMPARSLVSGKQANKQALCHEFNLPADRPTFSFIGRLVREKGADLLPDLFMRFLERHEANIIVLGTGDPELHHRFSHMNRSHTGFFEASLQYNERLSHQIYAGSDFILMPSRVEPCGLNQLFALRYGTLPIVRETGGLRDTVVDIGEEGGYGFRFARFTLDDALHAMERAWDLSQDPTRLARLRKRAISLDFSWQASTRRYTELYQSLI
jgi:starch synthase